METFRKLIFRCCSIPFALSFEATSNRLASNCGRGWKEAAACARRGEHGGIGRLREGHGDTQEIRVIAAPAGVVGVANRLDHLLGEAGSGRSRRAGDRRRARLAKADRDVQRHDDVDRAVRG